MKGVILALDESGKEYTSREFEKVLYKSFEEGGAHVTFIIGGFSGLPTEIKKKYPLISLSKMTWTHQFARLLLVEQIYRSTEIHKGSGYHKD
jgi:23S rRNA (pseudouridine1915-N3)-methyltransferase